MENLLIGSATFFGAAWVVLTVYDLYRPHEEDTYIIFIQRTDEDQ